MSKDHQQQKAEDVTSQSPGPSQGGNDLGFGTNFNRSVRFINRDGSFNVKRTGLPFIRPYDFYHKLITMTWGRFFLLVVAGYLSANILFSLIYLAVGIEHLEGTLGETPFELFLDAFFFSAQTITTLGYGRISPVGAGASTVAAIESMIGLLGFAMATGLLYGRFSRPHARIKWSEKAVVAPYRGITGLMFRIANERSSQLLEVEVQVVLSTLNHETGKRNFSPLELERDKVNFLPLSWTVVHPISENSPMYDWGEEELASADGEFIILVKAFDESFGQTIYSRGSYKFDEVEWGVKFRSIIGWAYEGKVSLELDRISETEEQQG